MSEPEVQKLLIDEGAIPQISPPPEEFKKFVDSEIVRWGELVRRRGFCTASRVREPSAFVARAPRHRRRASASMRSLTQTSCEMPLRAWP